MFAIHKHKLLSFEPVLSVHCLAELDFGAVVEQPFDCLIIQPEVRPCSLWAGDRMDIRDQHGRRFALLRHTHRLQKGPYTIYANRNGNVRHRCGGGWAGPMLFLAMLFQGGGSGMKVRSVVGLSNLSAFHRDPPRAPHLFCCCEMNWWVVVRPVQMGVSIWDAVHSHSMDRWALSGADVQAPWHGVLETVWLLCDGAQQVGCLRGWEYWLLFRTQATSHSLKGVIGGRIKEAGVRLWALQHQAGAQCSAVEWVRVKVDVHNVVAPAPQPESASRLKGATRDFNFLRSDSRFRPYVSVLSN